MIRILEYLSDIGTVKVPVWTVVFSHIFVYVSWLVLSKTYTENKSEKSILVKDTVPVDEDEPESDESEDENETVHTTIRNDYNITHGNI